jgi:hypothetical protein
MKCANSKAGVDEPLSINVSSWDVESIEMLYSWGMNTFLQEPYHLKFNFSFLEQTGFICNISGHFLFTKISNSQNWVMNVEQQPYY